MSKIPRLFELMQERGVTAKKLSDDTKISTGNISDWKKGRSKPSTEKLAVLSTYFNVSSDYLLGNEPTRQNSLTSNIAAVYDDHIRMIPVYESVSAGFGALAENTVTDYQPVRIVSDSEAAETICIRVTGDSMFPKIEDGDIIQVRKQDSVDSGDIAVVLLDGEEGLVKRVVYGETWIELHSINPMYPVQRFEGAEVQRLRVVGLVRSVIHLF